LLPEDVGTDSEEIGVTLTRQLPQTYTAFLEYPSFYQEKLQHDFVKLRVESHPGEFSGEIQPYGSP
jgi:hypothetical protein